MAEQIMASLDNEAHGRQPVRQSFYPTAVLCRLYNKRL